MDRIRTLIVDDEPPARAKVRRLLADRDDVEIVGEASNGSEAVERIRTLEPDLVILDIQMPELTGFEVLEALEHGEVPQVIFATAFDEHAIQAFEVAAVDYLLKPFDRKRLFTAVDRVVERGASESPERAHVPRILEVLNAASSPYVERIVVESLGRRLVIGVGQINRIGADGSYVSIHAEGRSYLSRRTLAWCQERLDPTRFVRVHRSTIVNVERVREIRPIARGDQILVLDDGAEVRMSRNYREALTLLGEPFD